MQERPLVSVTISLSNAGDRERLHQALAAIVDEDPSLRVKAGSPEERTILSGMSDQDLQAACDRISNEFDISLDVGETQVVHLETIRKSAQAEGKYIRQTGGSGNYGHCWLRIEPRGASAESIFVNEMEASSMPDEYVNAIGQGVREALDAGILAGFEIVGVKVALIDGSYHDADSNAMAFRFAASIALKEAARKAAPVLVEPVMAVEVELPEGLMGSVMRDMSSRRGRVEKVESSGGSAMVKAIVPLAEMLGDDADLGSIVKGMARYSMRFAGYEVVPRFGDSDDDMSGVPAKRPRGPNEGRGSASARFE